MSETELINGSTYTIGMSGDVLAVEFNNSGPATMKPAEWDAFVAAGNAALGRASAPLEERIVKAIAEADEEADKQAGKSAESQDLADGRGEGLRLALRMIREAGPTVPRAGVEALRARLAKLEAHPSNRASARAPFREALRIAIAGLDDLLSAPAPKEPGHADG